MGLNNAPERPIVQFRNNTNDFSERQIARNDEFYGCKSNETHICFRDDFQCYFNDIVPKQMSRVLMFGVIVPSCLVLIWIYIRIYLIFKRTMNRSHGNDNSSLKPDWSHIFLSLFECCCPFRKSPAKEMDQKTRELQTTIVLLITVLFFVICWVPLYIIDVFFSFDSQSLSITIETINALIVLRHFNSVLNPFLYAYHMKGFKKALKRKLICCCKKDDDEWEKTGGGSSTGDILRSRSTRFSMFCEQKAKV
ncbi:adenosine receptor A2a-like [Culicoides brevitarsis]|uniref:adenosine receptor A2a-like n=1 Tax=Culicoides brevitarsis TaxID=469753 RepID=UPI00307B52FF